VPDAPVAEPSLSGSRPRDPSVWRELRAGLVCLVAGLAMLGLFWGLAVVIDRGSATASGAGGALLVAYWLLGPAGVILCLLGTVLTLVNGLSLRSA